MKYTVNGFDQKVLVENELDLIDSTLLRYFVDFMSSGAMSFIDVEGERYYWIDYKSVIEELPIMRIKSKDVIYRHLKKMVARNILKHYTRKQGGTYSYYALGIKYRELLGYSTNFDSEGTNLGLKDTVLESEGSDSKIGRGTTKKSEGSVLKSEGYGLKVGTGPTKKSEQNNPSTSNPSTKDQERKKSLREIQEKYFLVYKKMISTSNAKLVKNYLEDGLETDAILYALEISEINKAKNFNYTKAIMDDWIGKELKTLADIKAEESKDETRYKAKGINNNFFKPANAGAYKLI